MLKILIVDDEILVRVGLKSCLDWNNYGFEIVGQAEDGVQALECTRSLQPEIILTDIKMPNMDGLELIRAVKKEFPWIKIIVLSCYNELEYIKSAIKLGAEDYILKLSMKTDSLLEIMNDLKDLIQKDKNEMQDFGQAKAEMRVNKYVIKEDIYRKLLAGAISINTFIKDITTVNGDYNFLYYSILCCDMDDYKNAPVKSRMMDHYVLKFSFINIIEECLLNFRRADVIEVEQGRYLILIGYENFSESIETKDIILECCHKMNSSIKKYLMVSATFGVCSQNNDIKNIRKMYDEASNAIIHKFYSGRESITFHSEACMFNNAPLFMNIDEENKLVDFIEKMDCESAKQVIKNFTTTIKLSKLNNPSKVRIAYVEILNCLMRIIKKMAVCSREETSRGLEESVTDIMGAETLQDIEETMLSYIDRLAEYLSVFKTGTLRPEISLVKEFVARNIGRDIRLGETAKVISVSKCYFSVVFKRETGENFTDYVNRTKMEYAKDLILYSGYKNYEAAEKVGITNESYFSKLFKKYIGVSPTKLK